MACGETHWDKNVWLVVEPPLLKNMSSSVGMRTFPIWWEKEILCSKPPIRFGLLDWSNKTCLPWYVTCIYICIVWLNWWLMRYTSPIFGRVLYHIVSSCEGRSDASCSCSSSVWGRSGFHPNRSELPKQQWDKERPLTRWTSTWPHGFVGINS